MNLNIGQDTRAGKDQKDTGGSRDTGKKTPGGAGTHTGHTGHTGARGHTDHTDEPHNHPPKVPNPTTSTTQTRTTTRRPKPRPTQQPQEQQQARSRPLPAADSEEAAPSEPDPASTHSHRAPPRACSKAVGERNEGARGRCVTVPVQYTGSKSPGGAGKTVQRHRGSRDTHETDTRTSQTNLKTNPTHRAGSTPGSRARPHPNPGKPGHRTPIGSYLSRNLPVSDSWGPLCC